MSYSKLLTVGCIAFVLSGAAAAQLPGIDAPMGAGIGATGRSGAEDKVEGRQPSDGGAIGGTERPAGEGTVRGGRDAPGADVPMPGAGALKDPIELCERLAGVERDICVQQARENRERALAPGLGATPGAGAGAVAAEHRQAPRR